MTIAKEYQLIRVSLLQRLGLATRFMLPNLIMTLAKEY